MKRSLCRIDCPYSSKNAFICCVYMSVVRHPGVTSVPQRQDRPGYATSAVHDAGRRKYAAYIVVKKAYGRNFARMPRSKHYFVKMKS